MDVHEERDPPDAASTFYDVGFMVTSSSPKSPAPIRDVRTHLEHKHLMRVVELTSWNERPALMSEWQRLWSEQPYPPVFVHPTWARTWWQYFGRGRRLRLLLVEDDGQAIALAPLYLERPFPAPGRLRIVGSGITSDYTDWLLPVDPEQRVAAFDALARPPRGALGLAHA